MDLRDPQIVWKWQLCGVLDYDCQSKLWLVQKVDSNGRVLDELGNPIVNGGLLPSGNFAEVRTQYWIPHIQLMFLAENPNVFAERIAVAFNQRKMHEAGIRYQLYLDCMPNEGISEISPASLKRITYLAKEDTSGIKSLTG